MSIEEKAGQLAQLPISAYLAGIAEPTGPMEQAAAQQAHPTGQAVAGLEANRTPEWLAFLTEYFP